MKRKEKISMINVVLQNIMHFLKLHFIQTCMHKKNKNKNKNKKKKFIKSIFHA